MRGRVPYLAIAAVLAAVALAASCKGATISRGDSPSGTSDVQLSFRVMGLGPAAESGAAKSISPLLLPTASTLTVVLAPTDSGLPVPNPQTVPIGSTSATVTFEGLEFGEYEVAAVATDKIGTALFAGGATVTFSESKTKATLTLIPADIDSMTLGASVAASPNLMLDAGTIHTYLVMPTFVSDGSEMLPDGSYRPGYYELSGGTSTGGIRFFVQKIDGTAIFDGVVEPSGMVTTSEGTSTYALIPAPLEEPSLITFYNDTASTISRDYYFNMYRM
jgi:hypothetical protein